LRFLRSLRPWRSGTKLALSSLRTRALRSVNNQIGARAYLYVEDDR
jgi:hypothetical protein